MVLEMEFQTATDRARRRILDRNLFAFLGDLVDAVGEIGNVKFKIDTARLGIPQSHTGGQVGRQMLGQASTVFDDGPAPVAHRASRPETPPATVIEELRRSGVCLVKSRYDPFPRYQGFVAGKTTGDRTVEGRARQRVL